MPAYSGMSWTSTPRPTIAAWWQTASTPRQRPVDGRRVADVADQQFDAVGQRRRDAGRVDGGQQRVQHPHLVAGVPGGRHDVRADEPGAAGDQDAHGQDASRRTRLRTSGERPAAALPGLLDPQPGVGGRAADGVDADVRPVEPAAALGAALEPHAVGAQSRARGVQLDEHPAGGTDELAAAGQQGRRVAADADVAVGEQDGVPAALAGHRVEDRAAERGRTGRAGQPHRDPRGVDADRLAALAGELDDQPAGAAAQRRARHPGAGEQVPVDGVGGAAPAAQRLAEGAARAALVAGVPVPVPLGLGHRVQGRRIEVGRLRDREAHRATPGGGRTAAGAGHLGRSVSGRRPTEFKIDCAQSVCRGRPECPLTSTDRHKEPP